MARSSPARRGWATRGPRREPAAGLDPRPPLGPAAIARPTLALCVLTQISVDRRSRLRRTISHWGFFVHRPFVSVDDARNCRFLEVLHVKTDWAGGEVGASWFYQTTGSGVFLDCEAIRSRGKIVAYTTRADENRAQHNPARGYGMHRSHTRPTHDHAQLPVQSVLVLRRVHHTH